MPLPNHPFYYIRHGQSQSNAARIMAGGGIDAPLTNLGREQAHNAAKILAKLSLAPQAVCYSPMLRAKETAEIINRELKLPMLPIDDLREHFVGEWEGKPWDEVTALWELGDDPPGGEKFSDFCVRVKRAMLRAMAELPPVLVVAHGGVWQAIKSLYGPASFFELDNAIPHHFEPVPEKPLYPWRVSKLTLCKVSGGAIGEVLE